MVNGTFFTVTNDNKILRVRALLDFIVLDHYIAAIWQIDAVACRAVSIVNSRVLDGRV